MLNTERILSDLLSSISGVLIFVSLAYWIDLNGFISLAPLFVILGAIILFWPKPFLNILSPLRFISKPILLTLSHILIFIGSKVYLDQFIKGYWIFYLILGIVLLNHNKSIAKALVSEGKG